MDTFQKSKWEIISSKSAKKLLPSAKLMIDSH